MIILTMWCNKKLSLRRETARRSILFGNILMQVSHCGFLNLSSKSKQIRKCYNNIVACIKITKLNLFQNNVFWPNRIKKLLKQLSS